MHARGFHTARVADRKEAVVIEVALRLRLVTIGLVFALASCPRSGRSQSPSPLLPADLKVAK